jgi:hypothetical protein
MIREQFQCITCGGTYFDRGSDGNIYHHACPPIAGKAKFSTVERPDKRDENQTTGIPARTQVIISEGKGTKCLTNPRLTEPAWITSMKAGLPPDFEE